MGGGQKRGRTQRRHFKQNRDNVWKHNSNPKKTRPDDGTNNDPNSNPDSIPNQKWEPFISQNPGFEEYYKVQCIVSTEEWEEFMSLLRKPLPAAFRINSRFHEFLKQENEVGNITRQEAVSMVPPLFLDVLPHHHVLDMCAAPGSKTFQLLEIIHQTKEPGLLPDGLVIANDVDVQRCNLLIHQTKRMCSANLIVTNHEAQYFPSCSLNKCSVEISEEEKGELGKSVLQFDRVLCDVPCSGDGTLRKAPDIWRKWNAGMGNGLHRLQVEIAMRGITLLKVGGRMVYSTCSMNPVENEAVVAEILRRSKGTVELLDVSSELPQLVRRQGLKTWKIRDRGLWLASYKIVPKYRRGVILPSMFPSDENCDEVEVSNDGAQEDLMALDSNIGGESISGTITQPSSEIENEKNSENLENIGTSADDDKAAVQTEASNGSASAEAIGDDSKVEVSRFPLERCMRIVPHDQNSGAFFIAVLQKTSPLKEDYKNQSSKNICKISRNMSKNLLDEDQSGTKLSGDVPHDQEPVTTEQASDDSKMDKNQLAALGSKDVGSEDNKEKEKEECDNGEKGHAELNGSKGRLQTQGKWKGVDPVLFFKDEATINSIRSFYGISESFPLEGHLVTRNHDANHVKRIYYVSKSVHDILQLNFQAGQKLKITSLGLKVFERQGSKDGTSPCFFRLSSEGLPLLLPYISKQILSASLADFRHLLQYRTIKFADFVDAKFGEKASELMPGCCVVILGEGKGSADKVEVDASTIAIVCWKGRTNLCIMVSELDGKELLERLSARFGREKGSAREEEKNGDLVIDTVENQELGELNEEAKDIDESKAVSEETVTS
ncbi:tRNA (cytosine(34)-C(5))-methyltransferase isoform X2 [Asparagus officinalis]|uniref:tRNA (cytosine(34)-C(5))-methyltransferase isoform X2 n=1 Tax=Asparagus officinalis TaxID=4686 RepID=UPI00098E314F|nr:tRNA (cytosine(34)-C(5))-methyltransferase isoform X2 [Asparagus officinalis]